MAVFPDVRFFFDGIKPQPKSLVLDPLVNLEVKLQLTDPDREKWSRIKNLQITSFTVNNAAVSASLEPVADGYIVRAAGYHCFEPGWYSVAVILNDDDGRRFSKAWTFEYNPDPPYFMAALPLYESNANGQGSRHSGYRVQLDQPIREEFWPYFERTADWTLYDAETGARIDVVSVSRCPLLANMVELRCAGEGWQGHGCQVDFATSELPYYSFQKLARLASDAVDDCMDPNKECPEDEEEEPPFDPTWPMPWEWEDPEINELPCTCGADVCYSYAGDFQCCGPTMIIKTGRCRNCPLWVLWRTDCEAKVGPQGQGLPQAYEPCPKEDSRIPLPTGDVMSAIWGGFPSSPNTLHFNEFPAVLTHATYHFRIGRWCPGPNNTTYWVNSFSLDFEVGDVDNPEVTARFIDGQTMLNEMQQAGPGARCERYFLNANDEPFNQTLAQVEAGCGRILKLEMEDLCLDLDPLTSMINVPGSCYGLPAKILEHPDEYPEAAYPDMRWQFLWDISQLCAYVCDHTIYSDCATRDGSGTQKMTYYYIWPTEIDPARTMVGPYGPVEDPYFIWDCANYFTWWVQDWPEHAMLTGSNWMTGCVYDPGPLLPWDTSDVRLLKRIDEGEIDLIGERDFRTVILAGGGTMIEPTEDMTTCTWEEVLDGVPFALYYNWWVKASQPHSMLATPIGVGPGDEGYEASGRPKLHVTLSEHPLGLTEDYRPPQKDGQGFDPTMCVKRDTGVWCWTCVKNETIEEATIEASPQCAQRPGDYYYIPPPMQRLPKRGIIEVVQELEDYFDHDNILEHPFVSGSENGEGANSMFDGPAHFAWSKFKCCYQPLDIRIRFIKPANDGWISIEDGVASGAIPDNRKQAWDMADVGTWRSFVLDDPETHEWNPPVFIHENYVNPRYYLHNDAKDGADGRDDIRRLDDNGFGSPAVDYPNAGKFRYSAIYSGEPNGGAFDVVGKRPKFTIGWDGRQWLLDEGINCDWALTDVDNLGRQFNIQGNQLYRHYLDHHTSFHSTNAEIWWDGGGDMRMLEYKGENEDDGGPNAGTVPRMYPPGRYEMEVWGEFYKDGGVVTATANLGTVWLAYSNFLAEGAVGGLDVYLDETQELLRTNNGNTSTESYLFASYGGPHHSGMGDVCETTYRTYCPILDWHDHNQWWWRQTDVQVNPLSYNIVLLQCCWDYNNRQLFYPASCFAGFEIPTYTPVSYGIGIRFWHHFLEDTPAPTFRVAIRQADTDYLMESAALAGSSGYLQANYYTPMLLSAGQERDTFTRNSIESTN